MKLTRGHEDTEKVKSTVTHTISMPAFQGVACLPVGKKAFSSGLSNAEVN